MKPAKSKKNSAPPRLLVGFNMKMPAKIIMLIPNNIIFTDLAL